MLLLASLALVRTDCSVLLAKDDDDDDEWLEEISSEAVEEVKADEDCIFCCWISFRPTWNRSFVRPEIIFPFPRGRTTRASRFCNEITMRKHNEEACFRIVSMGMIDG